MRICAHVLDASERDMVVASQLRLRELWKRHCVFYELKHTITDDLESVDVSRHAFNSDDRTFLVEQLSRSKRVIRVVCADHSTGLTWLDVERLLSLDSVFVVSIVGADLVCALGAQRPPLSPMQLKRVMFVPTSDCRTASLDDQHAYTHERVANFVGATALAQRASFAQLDVPEEYRHL